MLSAWEQRRKGIRPVKPFVGIDPVEYPRYIARKLQADMLYLVHHSPGMVYNGVFGIVKDPKDNSIRDIIDARPFNCARGGVATPVHLPSPADLARLQFAPGDRARGSGKDGPFKLLPPHSDSTVDASFVCPPSTHTTATNFHGP
jgi:hypothetical protein